jgi:hypothetical protein
MTYNTPEECEERFKASFSHDLDRPHIVIKHSVPLPQQSCYTFDFKTFEFAGEILLTLPQWGRGV